MTREDAVAGIAATVTAGGLKCTAVLDEGDYPAKVKVSDERMAHLEDRVLDRGAFHGEWNYAVLPAPRPAPQQPEPAAGPRPDLQGLAALAGIADLPALPGALAVPWQAAREQRLHLDRGRPRAKASGGGPKALPYDAVITAAACRLRLNMPWRLLGELLGTDTSTVSLAASRAIPLLQAHGITPARAGTRITTASELRSHAETTRTTVDIDATLQAAAARLKRRPPRTRHTQT
jgi:hypothetical protein